MKSETQGLKQKLQVFDIIKEATTIYVTNINFIILAFLISLPFFFLMVYFETLFQKTLVETSQVFHNLLLPFYDHLYGGFNYLIVYYLDEAGDNNVISSINDDVPSFTKDYIPVLIKLGFIYLVPIHFLELCSAIVTLFTASKLRSEQENKMSLKQMLQNSIEMSIMKGTFITSLYMLALFTGFLLAFGWIVSNCYSLYRMTECFIFFAVVCFVAVAKLLMVYLEWSAVWNMSIVVSVLDGIYGVGALRVSFFFSSGNQKRGFYLMLFFFLLGLCLRISSVSLGWYKGVYGIFLQIGLLCVLNTLKWVSCMIYFNDCKEWKMQKKVDLESGKDQLQSKSSESSSMGT